MVFLALKSPLSHVVLPRNLCDGSWMTEPSDASLSQAEGVGQRCPDGSSGAPDLPLPGLGEGGNYISEESLPKARARPALFPLLFGDK